MDLKKLSKGKESIYQNKEFHINVHRCITHGSQNLETVKYSSTGKWPYKLLCINTIQKADQKANKILETYLKEAVKKL